MAEGCSGDTVRGGAPIAASLLLAVLALLARAAAATPLYFSPQQGGSVEVLGDDKLVRSAVAVSGAVGFAFDGAGNLYAGASNDPPIKKLTPGGDLSAFASAQVLGGMACDAAGSVYAVTVGGTITKFTPDGVGSTFAMGLNLPRAIAFDAAGDLFVANSGAQTVLRITSDGAVSTFATGLNTPTGLAFDASGNLYVSNPANGAAGAGSIVRIAPGGAVTTIASALDSPYGLAVDPAGTLYVASLTDGTISTVSAGGAVSPYASAGRPSYIGFAPVPEPAGAMTLVMVLGAGCLLRRGRRRQPCRLVAEMPDG